MRHHGMDSLTGSEIASQCFACLHLQCLIASVYTRCRSSHCSVGMLWGEAIECFGRTCCRHTQWLLRCGVCATVLQVDTKDILFIVGGAFVDLDRQVQDNRATASLGFGNTVRCWDWDLD
jgi:hypothetical protein